MILQLKADDEVGVTTTGFSLTFIPPARFHRCKTVSDNPTVSPISPHVCPEDRASPAYASTTDRTSSGMRVVFPRFPSACTARRAELPEILTVTSSIGLRKRCTGSQIIDTRGGASIYD
jgi:hypothetical protein